MDCSGVGSRVSEADTQQLQDGGWVVIDDFLPESLASALRAEAAEFANSGRMPQHRFQFGPATFEKPNIFEADLHDGSMQEALPGFAELLFDDSLAVRLNELMPELRLEQGPPAKSLKLQHNRGQGGCFPCHYDNAGRPSRRSVTCVVYLNPEWQEGDGGEIVLCPFLKPQVVIPPLMGRAALFRSDRVLHSVRPAAAERFCFTIWLDSQVVNQDFDCNLTAKHLSTDPLNVASLGRGPVQRAVSRAVYAEEYEASLLACMSGAPGCEEMLAEHQRHVRTQLAHPQLGPFLEHLRGLKPDAAESEVVK